MPVLEDPTLGPVDVFEPPPPWRRFSPSDVLRLLVGAALVLGGVLVADVGRSTVEGIEADVLHAFSRLPETIESAILSFAQLATSLVPVVALGVLLVKRRWKVALLLVLASIVATLGMIAAEVFTSDQALREVLERVRAEDSVADATYPSSQVLAATTAMVAVAAPWLSRRWKRTLWWGVGVLVLMRLLAVAYPAFDLLVAVGVGMTVGSLILLVFGSPTNEPGPRELLDALVRVGLEPRSIERADGPGTGVAYVVTDGADSRFDVTLRTPDDADADLLARSYRALRFRTSEQDPGYATLKRRIEHEAMILLLASRHDVRSPDVVRIGVTEHGSAFVVTRRPTVRPLVDDDLRSAAVRAALWREVRALHDAGIAHRRLTLETIGIDDAGDVWILRFDEAETAPSEQDTARDVAELLTETAIVIGPTAAVEAAVTALGAAQVAPAMRMLQPLALPPSTRRRAKAAGNILQELREEVHRVTGEPEVELEHLERIKPRTVLIIVASTLAFYSLLPQLANLSDTVDAFGDARPQWIVAALLASATTYVFAAISFGGAVGRAIPFVPNLRAQVAASFTALVGPAGAGGFALTARFLQRVGVSGPEAGASVAVNAVGGFAVHMSLLVAFVLWSGQSELGGFSLPDSTTVLLILAAVLALAGILVAIGPVRSRFLTPAWRGFKNGLAHIGQVFTQPSRVAALFGGSIGLSLTNIVALVCAIQAFGGGVSFAQVGAAYLVAVALATLSPTPGGLGALESAMIAALTGYGLGAGVAVSSVLTFRLATFWLPILPGWFALGWMQRNDEL